MFVKSTSCTIFAPVSARAGTLVTAAARAAASSGRAPPLPAIVSALPAPKRQPDFTRLGLRDGRNACNPGPRNRRRQRALRPDIRRAGSVTIATRGGRP